MSAFTLTEMLVVLFVIGLLAALAMPTFQVSLSHARRSQCQNNLKHIGLAYAAIVNEHASNPVLPSPEAHGWAVRFKRDYLGANPNSLWCTATGVYDGRGLTGKDKDADEYTTAPDVKIRVYNGGALYDLDTFTTYPFWNEGDHTDYGRTTGIWKVSDDVYNGGDFDRYDMPMYTPGSNPKEYWFVIEDQRYADDTGNYGSATGDQDFNDFDLHVREITGGGVELTGFHRDAGYTFAVIDVDGNEYHESGGMLGPITIYGTSRVSYGMSTQVTDVSRFAPWSRKIIVTDYRAEMIYTGQWLGLDDGWDALQAPRHFGRLNALWADGSVTSEDPGKIDPHDPDGEAYWDPNAN